MMEMDFVSMIEIFRPPNKCDSALIIVDLI